MPDPLGDQSPATPTGRPDDSPIDFRVYTGGMATYGTLDVATHAVEKGDYAYLDDLVKLVARPDLRAELEKLPRPVVQCTGSSTEQDLQGDIMYASALKDMTEARNNLSIWMNHSYNLPDDLYGSLVRAPWLVHDRGFTDLYLQSDVEVLNPPAVQTYLYSVRGREIGVSGGFMVTESEWIERASGKPVDEDLLSPEDIFGGAVALGVKHVKAVEWSTVGIPANQRSWVETALKGLFERTSNPLLAPMVRELYPNKWLEIVSHLPDAALRKQLEDVTPRRALSTTPVRRILYAPRDGRYSLTDSRARTRSVTREEIADVLAHAAAEPVSDLTLKASDADKAAQQARSTQYGIGIKDGGHVTKPGQWSSVEDSAWGDPVNYRYPMPDKAHADNAASRWGDAGNRSQYSAKEQDIVSSRIARRQRSFGESPEDKEKTVVPPLQKASVTVAVDGSHDTFTGAHGHHHPAFLTEGAPADGQHTHDHEHNNDADHRHPHGKHLHVEVTAAVPTPDNPPATHTPTGSSSTVLTPPMDGGPGPVDRVTLDGDGNHPPIIGQHTHIHINYGNKATGDLHAHNHAHNNDGDHRHLHDGDFAAAASPNGDEMPAQAAAQVAMLKTYNDLGRALGLPPVLTLQFAPGAVKCNLVGDAAAAQRVISLVSDLDRRVDAIRSIDAWGLDSCVDELMTLLGVPDMDDDDGTVPTPGMIQTSVAPDTMKVGARNNASDLARMQQIHDHTVALTNGMVCKGTPGTGDPNIGGDKGDDSNADARSAMDQGGAGFAKAFNTLTAKTEQMLVTMTDVLGALSDQQQLAQKADQLRKSIGTYAEEAKAAREELKALQATPTGWPTDQTARALPAVPEASPQTRTLAEVVAQTTTYEQDGVTYRHWTKGLTVRGTRPELTSEQVARMSSAQTMNYFTGEEVYVPELTPPTEE